MFIDGDQIKEKILALTPKEAREIGIKYRSTLKKIKDRIEGWKDVNYKTFAVKKLVGKLI